MTTTPPHVPAAPQADVSTAPHANVMTASQANELTFLSIASVMMATVAFVLLSYPNNPAATAAGVFVAFGTAVTGLCMWVSRRRNRQP